MTFAAIPWLSISINLLLVVFVIVSLLMTLLILMQRPKQEGLGAAFGGGVTDQVFGARTTNVLQKGTVYCGTLFFVLALLLAILIGHQNKDSVLLDEKKPVAEEPATEAPDSTTPAEAGGNQDLPSSLLEELPEEDKTPDAPAEESDAPAVEPEAPADEPEAPAEKPDAPAEESQAPAEEPAESTEESSSGQGE